MTIIFHIHCCCQFCCHTLRYYEYRHRKSIVRSKMSELGRNDEKKIQKTIRVNHPLNQDKTR